ncbi:hypothetical protein TIFTF001_037592 [Ficus carica]|uniref:Uncharacterized protein n=1 Tax=Ficus carica TaxID=3494 RepID=A0AA88E5L0_FICCA|nr:hypothetical protein TIFTF001_037592 [Ficus carica]
MWPPGPHITPPKHDGNLFPGRDLTVWKVTMQTPTSREEPQMFVTLVGVRAAGNEHPLVTLEVVGSRGCWSRLHSIKVLEGPEQQLRDEVLRPENETAYQDAISISIELHQGGGEKGRDCWEIRG